jgi:tRNA-uridine 2-sulfurtransferase
MSKNTGKKVIVGISGGVDSSVSAYLLKKQGFEVVGIYFRFFNALDSSLDDAKKIAKIFDIPFRIVDMRKKFEKEVKQYFLREYKNGRTPNPCVICNEKVKFKILFDEMIRMKADYMATGHYAKIKNQNAKCEMAYQKKKLYRLFQADDKTKDQSYFLYRLPQKYLEKIIFPLGELKKSEVKAMAKELKLPVAEKKESQDVCFLKGTSTSDYLQKNLKLKKGRIVDRSGKIIGEHQGLALYTIGQRKGINIGGTGPYWVVSKDAKKNILSVSNKKTDLLENSKEILVNKVRWTLDRPKLPTRLLAQTRYLSPKVYATIDEDKKNKTKEQRLVLKFDDSQKAAAPGQSAVFYLKNGEVIGGGIIK